MYKAVPWLCFQIGRTGMDIQRGALMVQEVSCVKMPYFVELCSVKGVFGF